jgi:hypothetical protein
MGLGGLAEESARKVAFLVLLVYDVDIKSPITKEQ